MTDKFTVEVGQECEVYFGKWLKATIAYIGLDIVVCHINQKEYLVTKDRVRPIQSEDDKKRVEQIEALRTKIFRGNGFGIHAAKEVRIAEGAYKNGVRAIADDEYVVKALSDEQRERIALAVNKKGWSSFVPDLWRDIFDTVQRELGIGEK